VLSKEPATGFDYKRLATEMKDVLFEVLPTIMQNNASEAEPRRRASTYDGSKFNTEEDTLSGPRPDLYSQPQQQQRPRPYSNAPWGEECDGSRLYAVAVGRRPGVYNT
jgi:hypothetical protein